MLGYKILVMKTIHSSEQINVKMAVCSWMEPFVPHSEDWRAYVGNDGTIPCGKLYR